MRRRSPSPRRDPRGTSRRRAAVPSRSCISPSAAATLVVQRMPAQDAVEPVIERSRRDRTRHELHHVDPATASGSIARSERPRAVVGHEREGRPPRAVRGGRAACTARARRTACRPPVVADVAAITESAFSRAARSLAIATTAGLAAAPRPAPPRRRSSPQRPRVRPGSDASRFRHWSSAIGCERISRTSSSGTAAGADEAVADRQDRLGDDRERRVEEEVVRLVDGPGERALDRKHAVGASAAGDRVDDVAPGTSLGDEPRGREEAVAGRGAVCALTAGVGDGSSFGVIGRPFGVGRSAGRSQLAGARRGRGAD